MTVFDDRDYLDPDCCLGSRKPHDPHAPIEGWAAIYLVAGILLAIVGMVIFGVFR